MALDEGIVERGMVDQVELGCLSEGAVAATPPCGVRTAS